jgi:hypothetical protein
LQASSNIGFCIRFIAFVILEKYIVLQIKYFIQPINRIFNHNSTLAISKNPKPKLKLAKSYFLFFWLMQIKPILDGLED